MDIEKELPAPQAGSPAEDPTAATPAAPQRRKKRSRGKRAGKITALSHNQRTDKKDRERGEG